MIRAYVVLCVASFVVALIRAQAAVTSEDVAKLRREQDELIKEWRSRTDGLLFRDVRPRSPNRKAAEFLMEKTTAWPNLSDEVLFQRIRANDLKLLQVFGPEDEFNPRNTNACPASAAGLGAPPRELVELLLPSIGLVVLSNKLRFSGGDSVTCTVQHHGQTEFLCPSECFYNHYRVQTGPSPNTTAVGTAFLIESNLVLTARHVIDTANGAELCVIFGHISDGTEGPVSTFLHANVYGITNRPFLSSPSGIDGDWVACQLERACERRPLVLRRQPEAQRDEKVFKIGHPFGLPAIVAGNANVLEADQVYFRASLDACAGDSGAPVFDLNGAVIGIFRSGNYDYITDRTRNCRIPLKAPPGALGQQVTKVSKVPSAVSGGK